MGKDKAVLAAGAIVGGYFIKRALDAIIVPAEQSEGRRGRRG
jgi:hypothetical protein